MPIAHSKVTAQGQISVPAEVRRRLGIGPGSLLEWEASGDEVIVRRSGRHSSEDVQAALFEQPPVRHTLSSLKDGIPQYVRKRHAGR